MKLSLLMGLVAISISMVAAYYSIAGLAAIFSAAIIPIVIMGVVLEIGKVAGVVWLHYNWHRAPFLIKAYLVPAIIILMLITSMGIFGFLSKAHIEQTSATLESGAQVTRIETEIKRQNQLILRAEGKAKKLESSEDTDNTKIQVQIDKEQSRIDSAYQRIQPAITEQKNIIVGQSSLYATQVKDIDDRLTKLQQYIDDGQIAKAQGTVGTKADGKWGAKTAEKVRAWIGDQQAKRADLIATIERVQNNSTVKAARVEIRRLRDNAEKQITQANIVINRLRSKLGTPADNLDELIAIQFSKIKESSDLVDSLTAEKYDLQAGYRALEAEVGPIKYIAEFIYGDAGQDILDKAVRFVIIVIVIVFDPLAIILVLAATTGIKWAQDGQNPITQPNNTDELESMRAESETVIAKLKSELADYTAKTNTMGSELKKLRKKKAESDRNAEDLTKMVEERDLLRAEMTQAITELDVVQDEVNKVPVLETAVEFEKKKVQVLEEKILALTSSPVNTKQADIKTLQQTNDMLKAKIATMTRLSDFNIDDAQDLISAKTKIVDLMKELDRLKTDTSETNDS